MTFVQNRSAATPFFSLIAGAFLLLNLPSAQAAPPKKVPLSPLHYNKDVRPILAENCFACHGPDSAARKAGLRLDRLADATADRGGRAPIVKGKPEKSEIIRRILGQGPLMPPETTHKKLKPQEIATLKRWVAEGAEYETHWSFLPPKRVALPPVKNAKWVRNPIDRFILAKLEANGLTPAPEADRRTLARRLSLDLTGLPPTPKEVERFVQDKSADAYEKLVDYYLASPQWGEHRGRFWLDGARYADTHGIHIDNYREIWSYREWVINAFNRNLSFDQFTVEQLAGDLLPAPSLDQRIATGFNRCNITTSEGGAIDEEYAVLYTRDRTETTSQVWLGMTAGCAVCHDHKFDPLSQKEFYSMSAFFNNTTQRPMDGNVKDTPPVVPVPMMADRPRFESIKSEIETAKKAVEDRRATARPDFEKWLTGADNHVIAASVPAGEMRFHLPLTEGQGKEITATMDGKTARLTAGGDPGWEAGQISAKAFQRKAASTLEIASVGDFEKDQSFSYAAWVRFPGEGTSGAIIARMDDQHDFRGWDMWVEGNRVGTHIISKWPENALKVVSREAIKGKEWHHVCITYSGGAKPESVKIYVDGLLKQADVQSNNLKDSIRTTVPFKLAQRHSSSILEGTMVQDVRLYGKALTGPEAANLAHGTRAAYLVSRGTGLSAPEKDELMSWWLTGQDPQYQTLAEKFSSLENERSAILMRGTIAHVQQEKPEAAMAYVLNRGEYDKRRDKVIPATPAILPTMPANYPKNRLGFAKWLLLPSHPLTARVTANRFWQEVFGTGIVRTTGDFGITGEQPSNQDLLDWLAVSFMKGDQYGGQGSVVRGQKNRAAGTQAKPTTDNQPLKTASPWDVKQYFKLLVTSAAYRQAATTTPEKKLKDPANRLFSRGPRFRMDAEMVRDYALASSGLLVKKIGGPSVRPYQPDGVWEAVAMPGSDTRDYRRDKGEGLYRRSLYTFWKRSAPPASLEIFNAPSREGCTVRRERTNTPLQALVTLNDVQYVEAARNLAQKALKEGGKTDLAKANYIARNLLARPLQPKEQAIVVRGLHQLEAHYKGSPKDAQELITVGESKPDATLSPGQLAAWTMLTNQLMNLDEVLNK